MTIREIAKLAGVSPSTVSMVLNKKDGISEGTRKRVMDIIIKHGYSPKKQKISVKTKGNIRFIKFKREGLLVERNGDFITRVIDGVEDEARNHGFNLSITNVSSKDFDDMIDAINREDVDGVIFLGTEFCSSDAKRLQRLKVPIVVLDNKFENRDFDAVVMDNEAGVFLAVEHLKSLGHLEIGHLGSVLTIDNFTARENGFKTALEQLGLRYNHCYDFKLMPSIDESFAMMTECIKKARSLPTAFFADNDIIAIGAVRALKQAGIAVPKDISVIGFDDLPICQMIDPALSTIKILKKKMGQMAVSRLIDKLKTATDEKVKILVGAKLVARESTSPPNSIPQDVIK